jgi:hypothetical protein
MAREGKFQPIQSNLAWQVGEEEEGEKEKKTLFLGICYFKVQLRRRRDPAHPAATVGWKLILSRPTTSASRVDIMFLPVNP